MEIKMQSNNSSGNIGISYFSRSKKWRPRITVNNKEIYLGLYDSKEDAIEARRAAELKYHGEFRQTIQK